MRLGTLCRSLADALARITVRVSAPDRRVWSRAMAAELSYIDHDIEALRWAAGGLYASLLARLREAALLDYRTVRWGIALWAGYQAEENLCTGYALIAYKLHVLALAPLLARWCAGAEYQLLYPVFDTVSAWEIGLGLVAAALYILAAVQLIRRRFYGARIFVVALGACCGLWLYELSKPIYVEVFSLSDHLHDALLYALTGVLAWVVWAGAPRSADPLREARG